MRIFAAVACFAVSACGSDGSDGAPRFDSAAQRGVPLAGMVHLRTETPSFVRLEIDDGKRSFIVESSEATSRHALEVLGLAPAGLYTIEITELDEDGAEIERAAPHAPLVIATPPLPDTFPVLEVGVADPERMEPGVTLLAVPKLLGAEGAHLILVDNAGEVVWYYDSYISITDARMLANGHLLFILSDRLGVIEMDLQGVVHSRWHAGGTARAPRGSTAVATDSFHHEIYETAGGSFVALSSELQTFDDYPTSETDPTPLEEPANVVADMIVEFDRDGTVLAEWSLFDVLDPARFGYDSFGSFWNSFYTELTPTFDWTHANAVIPDPSDDSFIVSLRHQDAVFKMDRAGNPVWILGPHENWGEDFQPLLLDPTGDGFQWSYHQHAPALTPDGTLLLYDDAVHQASPPDPPVDRSVSRAVEYAVDEDTMEVRQVWEYASEYDEFTRIVGDADWLPETGNVLVTFGAIESDEDGTPSARIVEVTHETPAEKVFELIVADDNPDGPGNRVVYRAERLPLQLPRSSSPRRSNDE